MCATKKVENTYGSGTFRRRGNGSIEYRFVYMTHDGEKKRKSVSGRTETECLGKAEMFIVQEGKKALMLNYCSTIPEILKEKYYKDFCLGYTGEPGYARNLSSIKKIEKSYIGQIPINQVSIDDIEIFLISLTPYTDSVIEKTFSQLKIAFEEAKIQGFVDEDLIKQHHIRRPRSKKEKCKVYALTEDEQRILLDALTNFKPSPRNNNYRNQLLIELYTGMRMGEINALKPECIDFKNRVIHVNATISCGLNNRIYYKSHPKTDAGCRDVPMNEAVKFVLEDALLEMKKNSEGLVFWDYKKDGPVTTSQVCNFFGKICRDNGIKHHGQHALRHTFATRCIEAGVEPVVLKTWLGHTNIHITLDTYADVFSRMNNDNIKKFEDHLKNIELA